MSKEAVSDSQVLQDIPDSVELEGLFKSLGNATDALRRSHVELGNRVRSLEKEIAEKDRALERKQRLEALGKIAAGVAHEIRNPLGSLALYLDLLEEHLSDNERALTVASHMRKGISLLSNTVNDILTFTEPGQPHPAPCDIAALLEEAIPLAAGGDLNGVKVTRCFPNRKRRANVDPDWARRVFLNLLTNACQAMDEGGELTVQVRYGNSVVVRIEDTGPGLPEEDLEKAYLPFWSRREGGTGLGLSIVHSLVERQGGRLELSNRAEGGLEAKVVLPWRVNVGEA